MRSSIPAAFLLACVLASPLAAQGVSYDITSTGTHPDRKTGKDTTVTYMMAHGQFAKGVARLDITQSITPGGIMGHGTYTISNGATRLTTFVDPEKKQYSVFDIAELSKDANDLMKGLPGMMSITVSDVKVNMESLGAGENIEGYATRKYRLTESYTMSMSIMGHETKTPTRTTADIWIASDLDPIMNPSARPDLAKAVAATGMMAPLTNAVMNAYANVKPGLPLKRVSTTVSGEGDKTRTTTMTMLITNVKKGPIPASVFEVPAGYTKVEWGAAMLPPPPK